MNELETNTTKPSPLVKFFLTIKSWYSFFLSRWITLLIFAIIGGLIGIGAALLIKPEYQSKLTFALDEGGSGSLGSAFGIAAQLGLNIGGSNNDVFGGDNILEIIKSRRNIESVLLSVDSSETVPQTMINEFLKITEWERRKSSYPEISHINFPTGITKNDLTYLQDSVLKVIYTIIDEDCLVVSHPDKRLNIYEVNVSSKDEKFTKVFTDRLVKNAIDFYTEIRTKKSKETLSILENRAGQTKEKLNESITRKATVEDANLNPAFSEAQVPLQQQQANIQVFGGAYSELYKNMEIARFQYLKDIPLLQVIDAADYPMKKIKLGRLKGALIGSLLAVVLGIFILSFGSFLKQVKQYE